MNEEDQILILDYIDGELDELGQTKAMELLAMDSELKAFYEQSKVTVNQLQAELNSPKALAMEEELKDFVLSHGKERFSIASAFGFKNFPFKNLGSVLSLNNALVASFSFAFALMVAPSLIQQNINLNSSTLYEGEIVSFSTRGSAEDESLISEGFFTDGYIIELISSESKSGKFVSSKGLIVTISIHDSFKRRDKSYYYGVLSDNKGNEKQFVATRFSDSESYIIGY